MPENTKLTEEELCNCDPDGAPDHEHDAHDDEHNGPGATGWVNPLLTTGPGATGWVNPDSVTGPGVQKTQDEMTGPGVKK